MMPKVRAPRRLRSSERRYAGIVDRLSGLPTQVGAELGRVEQLLDLPDPAVTPALDVVESEPVLDEGLIELPGAFASGPLRPERGQHRSDLRAINPIVARVWAGVGRELDHAPWHDLVDDLGELTDAVVPI